MVSGYSLSPSAHFCTSFLYTLVVRLVFGIRIAVSIIKLRMEMDGLNTEARWPLSALRR
jgi:hypothetical protein